MNYHDGVSCDFCLKSNFSGLRYKCLRCFDYDLCADCYNQGENAQATHTLTHPMQCILTPTDFELFYGGELVDQPTSLTCPYCSRMGFNITALQEHLCTDHLTAFDEVICPVCAATIGGEPNFITKDLARHLVSEHRAREGTVTFENRHVIRRNTHGRNAAVARIRRPNTSSRLHDISDPVAEFFSQLSGIRRPSGSDITITLGNSGLRNISGRPQTERVPTRQPGQANIIAPVASPAIVVVPSTVTQKSTKSKQQLPAEKVETVNRFLLAEVLKNEESSLKNSVLKAKFMNDILFASLALNEELVESVEKK